MTITLDFPILGTASTIQDIEDVWLESEDDDLPCDRYEICGKSAQIMVLWHKCELCGAPGGKNYYCLICYDVFMDVDDGGTRWGSCEYCEDGYASPFYVTTIR